MSRTVPKVAGLVVGKPEKPPGLGKRAGRRWDKLMAELDASGLQVTPAHRSWLEMAATMAVDIADAKARVRTDGAYIESKTGLVAHPASKRLDALRRDRVKVLTMLGIRVAVSAPEPAGPSMDDELNGTDD